MRGSGPTDARIMIVGEAPGEEEERRGQPFVGASGMELNRMLTEAGIDPGSVFKTNVCRVRPPGNDISLFIPETKKAITADMVPVKGRMCKTYVRDGLELLMKEIELIKPDLIIPVGNVALWALTDRWGIRKWRGSQLTFGNIKVVPTYHPAAVLREWSIRRIVLTDLRRAKRWWQTPGLSVPDYKFIIRPQFPVALRTLQDLWSLCEKGPTKLAVDIETRMGHTACIGIAWSKLDAICIPWMCTERKDGFWTLEEETHLQHWLRIVLTHPNARIIGQNFIYDTQYIHRHNHYVPNFHQDTMWQQHSAFSGMPKGLDFLSSMYCSFHVYWKDEGKDWHQQLGEDQLWLYNCKDCVATFEIEEVLSGVLGQMGLTKVNDFQQSMFHPVLKAMIKGVRRDAKLHAQVAEELMDAIAAREQWIIDVLGHPLNPASPVQMKRLFYEDLAQRPIFSRKTKAVTLDDDALATIAKRQPLLRPLITRIQELRSLNVFLSTFVNAKLDSDGRIRSSFNVAGTETYRLASSKSAFDSGMNMQNLPVGGKENPDDPDKLVLPNIRKLFVPDPGYTFFDMDLDRADLQVVVWEADDGAFKDALRRGVDMHLYNARDIFGIDIPDDEIVESHPKCAEHKERYRGPRQKTKAGVHATNYFAQPRTLAEALGVSVAEAEKFQRNYFAVHPGIKEWQNRTNSYLRGRGYVENAFGYRRYYFDRPDGLLPEALAWVPQSTVAITINKIWKLFDDNLPDVDVLLQVHDSLAGQIPTMEVNPRLAEMRRLASTVVIPYPDPLIIPVGFKTSPVSWGACK